LVIGMFSSFSYVSLKSEHLSTISFRV
jgi:hypothetical protein